MRDLTRRELMGLLGTALLVPAPGCEEPGSLGDSAAGSDPGSVAQPPNLVVIVVDDMRWDFMSCAGHPVIRTPQIDRIATNGVRFENAFVTTSLCSPSRASILTGMYVRKHGVVANGVTDLDPELPMFPRLLQAIGYRTALVGKWHMRRDSRPRPGFDHWLSFRGQGDYIDPIFNRNGTEYQARGYVTDLLTDEAVEFLRLSRGRPFCLYLAHKAVHAKIVPAERHANLYAGAKLPDPAADTLAGKPRWLRQSGARHVLKPPSRSDEEWREYWRQQALGYYRALAAVDEGVGRVLDAIDEIGATNQTMVVLTSDNGLLLGEHGRGGKRVAYEESIRVPLLVSGPGVRNRGRVISDLVLNVDLAPTLLELGGAAIQSSMHGRSLAPLLAGEDVPWRSSFLYEYYVEHGKPAIPTMLGVRTRDWKYTQYPNILDFEELYHLAEDPHELNNLADDPSARGKLGELRAELERLTREIS